MPSNIRLGWKSWTGANDIAYYDKELIMAAKSVYKTRASYFKHFSLSLTRLTNKLECLFMTLFVTSLS
jgi:hypothetical protein